MAEVAIHGFQHMNHPVCETHGKYSFYSPAGCAWCRMEAAEAEVRAEIRRLFAGERAAKYQRVGSLGGMASARSWKRPRVDRSDWPTLCACGSAIVQDRTRHKREWCEACRVKRKKEQDRASDLRRRGVRA